MARFSKVPKIKAKRTRAVLSRIKTIIYDQSLMRSWEGPMNKKIQARADVDATGLVQLITSIVPSLTYEKVLNGLLETAAQDPFYNVVTRDTARRLLAKRKDAANQSF